MRVLEEMKLEPQRLKLEIVETALMKEQESTIETLRLLRNLGVGLAIDDFGSGYSSLSYLRRFPVDTLKIDHSFLSQAQKDQRVEAIIEAIVSIAHVLGMDVVAEGVETTAQLRFLLRANCDRAQGFLFSRPLPEEHLQPFVRAAVGSAPAPITHELRVA